jgi:hypothetical protein
MVALTTISFPVITSIGGSLISGNALSITNTTALTTLHIGASLKRMNGSVVITSAVLGVGSVNELLIRLAALDGTNGTTSFSNKTVVITGTSAAPTVDGITAKNTLISRGCSVTTN